MSEGEASARRLVTLETKVAYQDKTIAELNDVVVDLNKAVADLLRRVQAVEGALRGQVDRREVPNDPPPHY